MFEEGRKRKIGKTERKKENAQLLRTDSVRRGLEAQCLGKHQMMELFCREEASDLSIIQKGILFTSLIPSSLDDTCFTSLMLCSTD